ncbi:AMP-binding enzyme [Podospora appendiculata]|uniref:AMP-binding enzyme n=1 Tax=Podospora appendiculata TaxID=314037 RepID=A0AAE0XAX4_9PEZI|nr:AMP-binding enzyme [Podospora appendiculata]
MPVKNVIDTSKDLAELFLDQVRATPNATALEDGDSRYSYLQLDEEVATLTERLQELGVGRDTLVGVLLGRSSEYVIACLAILRAGGAFLVLELAYPPSLLADVIDDAKPLVIITHSEHTAKIACNTPTIIVDQALEVAPKLTTNGHTPSTNGNSHHIRDPHDLDKLAFVSYSSGTTGRPKGIANPQSAAVRSYNLRFGLSDLSAEAGDRVACNVFFVWEILRPLLRGASVFAVSDEVSYDPVALVDCLSKSSITETLMTPTLLATLLCRHPNLGEKLPHLRTLWLNGEVVTTDLARRAIKALPKTRLLNCYSASETHEIACGDIRELLIENSHVCPVGPPMDPEHTYILNESGERVSPGKGGELFVGGGLLARGYLNLPETTSKAFLADPFDPTPRARMYRTGDLARILPSGYLEITGRVGAMIKIRGYSVQPPAVESAIVKRLAVKHCAITAHGDGLHRQIVAYIVLERDDPAGREIPVVDECGYSPASRKVLTTQLAHYMIPTIWVVLDELPTHEVSGKIDLKSLPAPLKSNGKGPLDGAKKDGNIKIRIENIAEMWAGSLNLPVSAITQEHDFFDLGGHSLALADLARRFSQHFGFHVPLTPLAGNPTLKGHLDIVCRARDGHTAAVQADLPSVLQADSVLDDDIRPAPGTTTAMQPLNEAHTVLLTGATGFLGAFLLGEILERTSAHVICVVRFNEPSGEKRSSGMARLRKNLVDLGIWQDSILDRIEVLPGNLVREHLGLSPESFTQLASRVQVIIHAAATVNLVYPYAALRNSNVGGTREILRLACASGATVHHISTNGVLPPSHEGWSESTLINVSDVPTKLLDGYGQTKWVAERLVLEAIARGVPARIYRPGTISGHSSTGSTNAWDLLTAVIVESLHIGSAPTIDGWQAEMTPVDFVSKAIITLCSHTSADPPVFHIGDPNPIATGVIFERLSELGYATELLDWDSWVSLWSEKRGSTASKGGDDAFTADILRGGMPTAEFLSSVTVLKDPATNPFLALYGLSRPAIDINLLETYTRHFYARGWLSKPPRRNSSLPHPSLKANKGPLAGKVAVITGASSGIGAAVAIALAREGAHVALAARRTPALDSIKHQCHAANSGSKILVCQTDVTSKPAVDALMATATAALGPVDILVVCAGVMYFTLMANAHTEDWDRTVDVNCKGLLHALAATVPGMLARGSGHVVAISSDAGRKVFPGLGVYSASKFFVEATLQSLRLETVGSGLRVTSVQPGNTATELLGLSTDTEAVKKYGEPTGAKVLDAEDVAGAVVYALRQPGHVAVNEVLIEPRDEPC